MNARVLLVEDEPGIVQVLGDLLRAEGHTVESTGDGDTGLDLARNGSFDLLILDVMLPGLSGVEVCQAVREQGYDGAILMLTALGSVPDRVQGLRAGADDYLAKPFDPDELLARVDALLRRARNLGLTPVTRFEFGDIVADFSQGQFTKNGVPVNLAAKEADLLRLLINRRGQIVSRGGNSRPDLVGPALHHPPHRGRACRLVAPENRRPRKHAPAHPHRPRRGLPLREMIDIVPGWWSAKEIFPTTSKARRVPEGPR